MQKLSAIKENFLRLIKNFYSGSQVSHDDLKNIEVEIHKPSGIYQARLEELDLLLEDEKILSDIFSKDEVIINYEKKYEEIRINNEKIEFPIKFKIKKDNKSSNERSPINSNINIKNK